MSKRKSKETVEFEPVVYEYKGHKATIEWCDILDKYRIENIQGRYTACAPSIQEAQELYRAYIDERRVDDLDEQVKKLKERVKDLKDMVYRLDSETARELDKKADKRRTFGEWLTTRD